jgi:hypothetical protein
MVISQSVYWLANLECFGLAASGYVLRMAWNGKSEPVSLIAQLVEVVLL